MANTRTSDDNREYALVDTTPGASGYYTNEVIPRNLKGGKQEAPRYFFLSIRGTGTMDVALQFKCEDDDDWTTYETYSDNERKYIVCGGPEVSWRAGVVDDAAYSSGSKRFGFDW